MTKLPSSPVDCPRGSSFKTKDKLLALMMNAIFAPFSLLHHLQRSSEIIRDLQRSSEVFRDLQRSSEVFRDLHRSSETHCVHRSDLCLRLRLIFNFHSQTTFSLVSLCFIFLIGHRTANFDFCNNCRYEEW